MDSQAASSLVDVYLQKRIPQIEERLSLLVPEKECAYRQLFEATRYSLLGGGKRIRPLLALAIVEMFKGSIDKALTAVCVLEIIHTYSLIHDDLPCIDNDDFRRGKPSLHKKYKEGVALLAGDFLLTHAFAILMADPLLTFEQKVKLTQTLTQYIGGDGIIGGQFLDITLKKEEIDLPLLQKIHEKKTAALFTAAMEFGGILANASEEELFLLKQFGHSLGLNFQVIDDILDASSATSSSDIANDKVTYVSLLGIEQAHSYANAFYSSAQNTLHCFPHDSSLLQALAHYLCHRQK